MLKKLTLITFIALSVVNNTTAQTYFHKTFTPQLRNIEQEVLSYNDVIILGEQVSSKSSALIISRFNSCGHVIWSKKISSNTHSISSIDFRLDKNQNIIIGGNHSINGARNAFVLSITSSGLLNFFKTFDTGTADIAYSLDINQQNEVFIYFKTNIGQAGPNSSNTLAKLKATGEIVWIKQYGFTWVWGQMCATADGGALISDTRAIVKINDQGNVSWNKEFEESYYSQDHFEIPNGYVFFRYSISSSNNSYATMLNKNGSLKWNSQLIPNFNPSRGILRSNGNLLFVGDLAVQAITNNLSFIEIDTASGIILNTSIKKDLFPLVTANDLAELSDNNIIYCGNAPFGTKGGSFISRLNDTLSLVACKDSIINLTYPTATVNISSVKLWTSSNATIPIDSPEILVEDLAIIDEQLLCGYSTPLTLDLGEDTTICPENRLTLGSDTLAFDGYLWSTGESTRTINVNQEGEYYLEAWLACDTISDTIQVNFHPSIQVKAELTPDTAKILDTVNFSLIKPKSFESIIWNFGDGSSSTLTTTLHQYRDKGSFKPSVSIIDSLGCKHTSYLSNYILGLNYSVPNVFTPNGDGTNDFFTINGKGITNTNIKIYNRWGELIFNGENQSWDGSSYNGQLVAAGTYFYIINFLQLGRSIEEIKGSVSLIR
ncbi:MAG: gliding motility-associated C-terminal domain-containing protein [Vicingaceae bacterium]